MAIGNVTPDSFYAASRFAVSDESMYWLGREQAMADGADILDIGGLLHPSGQYPCDEEKRMETIGTGFGSIAKQNCRTPPCPLDTFRPEIARRALEQFGPMIINDISGGCEAMYSLVRSYEAPYIWTLRGDLELPPHAER